jgi:hypothetical protein
MKSFFLVTLLEEIRMLFMHVTRQTTTINEIFIGLLL